LVILSFVEEANLQQRGPGNDGADACIATGKVE
jgi:hypothetical protein